MVLQCNSKWVQISSREDTKYYIRLKIKPNRVTAAPYTLSLIDYHCCQIIILSIYVPSTHAYTHVLDKSIFFREWM